jgi:hypothetical protein
MAAIDPGLDELLRDYTEGRAGCGYECSAMHLGALVQDLHRLKLIERTPTPRLHGLSLVEMVERLRDMRSPSGIRRCYLIGTGSRRKRTSGFTIVL